MFASSTCFSRKATSLPKRASLLWYLTENLNLLSLFDHNVGLTIKFAMVIVSDNVEENEPLSQTRVDMTKAKTKHVLSVSLKTAEG